ncbi:MAG: ATP-dependent protease LonB, partial [Alicyclobacillus sp.]|nr:ATP-dependent protease LonB [Alicyclobacillus sp.]
KQEIAQIVVGAVNKLKMPMPPEAIAEITKYATNGREAVNIVQIAGGLALAEGRDEIRLEDVQWVIQSSQINPRPERQVHPSPQVGVVNGLAVYGPATGILLEIEVTASPAQPGEGTVTMTGLVEEETIHGRDRNMRRKSMAKSSLDNVLTALRRCANLDSRNYHLHINFPGGMPVDGPSAGIAMATAIYSAITGIPVLNTVAMTGEISIRGLVRPVGGVPAKIEAAVEAGAKTVIIPKENWQEVFRQYQDVRVVAVEKFEEVLNCALIDGFKGTHAPFDRKMVMTPAAVSAAAPTGN